MQISECPINASSRLFWCEPRVDALLGYWLFRVARGSCTSSGFRGFGGAEEDRTPDLLCARQVLSQLSYGPRANKTSVVGLGGLEPPASPLSGVRSNQLSYRPGEPPEGGSCKFALQTWRPVPPKDAVRASLASRTWRTVSPDVFDSPLRQCIGFHLVNSVYGETLGSNDTTTSRGDVSALKDP